MTITTSTQLEPQIDYPESDGKPMAETDAHIHAIIDTIATLSGFFRHAPTVYVAGNMLLYYQQGNPAASVAPDVFVVHGVSKDYRRTYRLWDEGHPPSIVIEFTTHSTRREDLVTKRDLYAALGVREYFLCDLLAEYLRPALQGFRLVDGEYMRLAVDGDGALVSEELGLRLRRESSRLRLVDAATGDRLLWPDEEIEARRLAEERAAGAEERARAEAEARRTAEERARTAEAEIERLYAELARLRAAPDD